MAVDEWLLRSGSEHPLLRIYEWQGDWVSLGYFQSLGEARSIFGEEPQYVRRWTGGGIVDHRSDTTYTLIIPRNVEVARLRGADSYCAIHQAVADCLGKQGVSCALTGEDSSSQSKACFQKPVRWDLVAPDGRKLAGAGQRRSREGVLHQGSVAGPPRVLKGLENSLAKDVQERSFDQVEELDNYVGKYSSDDWLSRIP